MNLKIQDDTLEAWVCACARYDATADSPSVVTSSPFAYGAAMSAA